MHSDAPIELRLPLCEDEEAIAEMAQLLGAETAVDNERLVALRSGHGQEAGQAPLQASCSKSSSLLKFGARSPKMKNVKKTITRKLHVSFLTRVWQRLRCVVGLQYSMRTSHASLSHANNSVDPHRYSRAQMYFVCVFHS